MKFTCISDTHNRHEEIEVPEADIVIHSGDSTGRGSTREITEFCEWYGELPHQHKILIAGNHDWGFEKDYKKHKKICDENGIIYLQDSGCEIEGIKFWGSPQTPEFCNWAFNCWRTENEEINNSGRYGMSSYKWIGKYWKMIPDDIDILITHGPPYDILDYCQNGNVGCVELRKTIERIKPKFHIFGHIHEDRGEEKHGETTFINASSLDGGYYPTYEIADIHEIGELDEKN